MGRFRNALEQPHIAVSGECSALGACLFTEPTPLDAFRSLDIPVLFVVGKRSPASARGVARLLTAVLPRVEMLELEDLGHMGPMTHPDLVNDAIAQFLEQN
jgi:pimeloyl-ACP methyl ester carboxylesterase